MTEGRSNAPKLCIIWYVIWWSAFVCCKFYSHPNAWCYDIEIPISGKTNVHFGPWPPLFVILRSILWRADASVNLKSLRFPSRWSIFFALLPTCEAEHLTRQNDPKHTWPTLHTNIPPNEMKHQILQQLGGFSVHGFLLIQEKQFNAKPTWHRLWPLAPQIPIDSLPPKRKTAEQRLVEPNSQIIHRWVICFIHVYSWISV